MPKNHGSEAKGQYKFEKVMHEFGAGTLRSSSGQKVTDHDQALAIAFSEQRKAQGKKTSRK